MATGPPIPDDLRKSGDVGHPSARSASAQAGRKGGWPVSDRLPICDRLLRTAQSVEPCSLREEGPLPDWLVAFGCLLSTNQPMVGKPNRVGDDHDAAHPAPCHDQSTASRRCAVRVPSLPDVLDAV